MFVSSRWLLVALAAPLAALASCGGGGDAPDAIDAPPTIDAFVTVPFFPEGYVAAGFAEVRDCRGSADHDLSQIRILASPDAIDAYTNRTPIPTGAVLVKEQYDFSDDACSGPILELATIRRDPAATETLGWRWQRVAPDREVLTEDESRCYGCHDDCLAPDGFEFTCAVP